ncbi:MAG: phosphoenolpyruvate carboxylase, partial [Brevundimonas diminuta]|nr:phosphoenolpyruvate carboxylase [Brevundimonas diminuta]
MTQAPEFPHDRLRDEVRLLGALLGEVIRDEGGQDLYDRIEAVRRASVAYHRDPASDDASELERLLGELSLDQAIGLTHGFAAFSLLANVAEDRAGKRRAQAQAEAGERADTPEGVLKRLAEAGADRNAVRDLLAQALISPVLTAHPSEVRRKSVIDRTTAVGELLDGCDRDGIACDADTLKAALRRQIVILWATRLTRASALVVQDEIDTVVDWLQRIFLHVAPAQLAEWRRLLDAPDLTPFVRIGSWVGGDRDGNPNVDADTLRAAFRSQARAALGFYLDEVHALGAELSLSIDLTRITPELAALAQGSGDASIQRADEPYRRALSQIYARRSAAHPALTGEPTPR